MSVPIILEQNISGGFAALEFGVKYSSGDLTLLSVKSGKDFELSIDDTHGYEDLLCETTNGEYTTANGEVIVLEFLVSEYAAERAYEITLFESAPGYGVFQNNSFPYKIDTDVTIIPGTISLAEPITTSATFTSDDCTVNGACGYGGAVAVDQETGTFTFSATNEDNYHYVLDQIFVDGIALTDSKIQGNSSYTWAVSALGEEAAGTHSVVATFAYTLNFLNPASGTLSVSRGGETLTSGSIVRGGDVLTITPPPGYAVTGLAGLTDNGDGAYTVTAQNGEPTPAFSLTQSTYRLTAAETENGSVTLSVGGEPAATANVGYTVTVTTQPDEGYALTALAWQQAGGEAVDILEAKSFAMPAADVTVTAEFSRLYAITGVGDGLSFTVDGREAGQAVAWAAVEVTVTPPEGSILSSLTYSFHPDVTVDITQSRSFYMPQADVTVTAVYLNTGDIRKVTEIATEEDLRMLAAGVNNGIYTYEGETVTLKNDVALTGAWTPIGNGSSGSSSTGVFRGTFEGGGHTVSGLSIDTSQLTSSEAGMPSAGLFGAVNGTIRNLNVEGTIRLAGTDNGYVGGIVGSLHGAISGCTSMVDVTVTGGASYLGGVAGYLSGEMSGCYNRGSVTGEGNLKPPSEGTVDVYNTIHSSGGLSGDTSSSGASITGSFNRGAVTGHFAAGGGLVGNTNGRLELSNSYSTGTVRQTAEGARNGGGSDRVGVGELLGNNSYNRYAVTMTNCFSSGAAVFDHPDEYESGYLLLGGLMPDTSQFFHAYTSGSLRTVNCYGSTEIAAQAADFVAESGGAYLLDEAAGLPRLANEPALTGTYTLTFTAAPETAQVRLYRDSARTELIETAEPGVYTLEAGSYFYTVSAGGYQTQEGTVTLSVQDVEIAVTLRQAVQVTFNVTPAAASFALAQNGTAVQPDSQSGSAYTYTLLIGSVYSYSASAPGYNSVTREYQVTGPATVDVTLSVQAIRPGEEDGTVYGSGNAGMTHTITKGGTYLIGEGATGAITVQTAGEVVLVGGGVGLDSRYEDLYIDCTGQISSLTLQDVYISNSKGEANMIDFHGTGNTLTFAGTCILDQDSNATGYAMIHVDGDTSLTISGGAAYLYKHEQGACIGGNGAPLTPEVNGSISIEDAELFIKNSKQGAAIGPGAGVGRSGIPGGISIEGSTLNIIANSRGAAIGGSAGSEAAPGGSVSVSDSMVNINLDFSGAAIGGGGFASGNDSDGGSLDVSNSSVRAYIDENATGYWGVSAPGVNGNKGITASVTADGAPARLLIFDTSSLSGSSFDVYASATENGAGEQIYSGGLHQYGYINEDTSKSGQANVSYTISNWVEMDDPCLYLYVPAEDTLYLTVNGQKFKAAWNADTETFTITNEAGEEVGGGSGGGSSQVEEAETESSTVIEDGKATVTVDSEALSETLESAKPNTQIVISADLDGEDVDEVTLVLTGEDVSALADTKVSLRAGLELAGVTLSNTALKDVAAEKGDEVTLTAAARTNGVYVEVAVDGKAMSQVEGGVRVTLPVSDPTGGTVLILVGSDGTGTVIKKSAVVEGGVCAILEGSCTVRAEDRSRTFADVKSSDWFAGAVAFVSSRELFQGVSDAQFAPTVPMTRAMLVTVLHRLEDQPGAGAAASFGDVPAGAWYALAVAWASENSIVTGTGSGFNPDGNVTREQIAAILYRYMRYLGPDVSASGDLSKFSDGGETSGWAEDAMKWAVGAGILTGKSGTILDPTGTASRAEVATMLQRLVNLMI